MFYFKEFLNKCCETIVKLFDKLLTIVMKDCECLQIFSKSFSVHVGLF